MTPFSEADLKITKSHIPCGGNGRKGERTGGRHVRTGCITCKIRHVKCDEEKPACNQCRKTGRVCDGYNSEKRKSPKSAPLAVEGFQTPIRRPDHGLQGSQQERRSFHMFECEIGQELLQAFTTPRTHQLILQASHSNEAVKHAVIALGSLREQTNTNGILVVQPPSGDQGFLFPRLQYSKAIRQLHDSVSNPTGQSLELILLCCLLLITFDFLCGDDLMAQVHLKAGLALLHRCYPQCLHSRILDQASDAQRSQPLICDLFRMFSVVDLHGAIWLGLSSFNSTPLVAQQAMMMTSRPENVDSTLDNISLQLNYHLMRAHAFRHRIAIDETQLETFVVPDHVLQENQSLLSELRHWPSLLEQYVLMIGEPPEGTVRRICLMKMNYYSTLIGHDSFIKTLSPIETGNPQTYSFSQILVEARQILQPPSLANREALLIAIAQNSCEPDPHNIPPFAFVSGAIQPLFITAAKCEDPILCETAVSMLEELPWKEGAWNSAIMANIARRHMRKKFSITSS